MAPETNEEEKKTRITRPAVYRLGVGRATRLSGMHPSATSWTDMSERQDRPVSNTEPVDPLRVWFRFIRLSRRVTAAVATELRELGLSIPQFDVLSTLSEREGLTQQELAARLYVTKGNVSGLIDRLVEAGLVERRPIPGDRRSHALHLTEAGARVAARGIAAQADYVARTLGRLDEADLRMFEDLVVKWRELARSDAAL
ncbi:DNA-binding MarR family transcriptional regulator [Methylorubrum zatmanii]|nr:DNA-binding MarR family transcriptional regulator [Methylorubrum zatmanii]MCP1554599.1 DNA-binding MarR family transcriptional regulator [Methylorubrum extorquens]MCP1579091.1 DNA-binding MarR family transcriptional regulator [Methylorubrum extorquens]